MKKLDEKDLEEQERRREVCEIINKGEKEYTANERSRIKFSIAGAVFGMASVVASAIANVRNRSVINVLVLLASAALTVYNGVNIYNGIEDFKGRRKEFYAALEESLNEQIEEIVEQNSDNNQNSKDNQNSDDEHKSNDGKDL